MQRKENLYSLFPFTFLCYNVGCGGLDREGYESLENWLRDNAESVLERFYIGPFSDLESLETDEGPLLKSEKVKDKKVYFLAAFYVMGINNSTFKKN